MQKHTRKHFFPANTFFSSERHLGVQYPVLIIYLWQLCGGLIFGQGILSSTSAETKKSHCGTPRKIVQHITPIKPKLDVCYMSIFIAPPI